MSGAFVIQFLISLAAIAALVGLSAWLGMPKDTPPLTEETVRSLLAQEGSVFTPRRIWIASDGRAAVARDGDLAVVIFRVGDGHVVREGPWSQLRSGAIERGQAVLKLETFAPAVRVSLGGPGVQWPPEALSL